MRQSCLGVTGTADRTVSTDSRHAAGTLMQGVEQRAPTYLLSQRMYSSASHSNISVMPVDLRHVGQEAIFLHVDPRTSASPSPVLRLSLRSLDMRPWGCD